MSLHVDEPLFATALNWIGENELGLCGDKSALTLKEVEAIKFVHSYTRIYDEQCREEIRSLTSGSNSQR